MNLKLNNFPNLYFSVWLLNQDTRNDSVGRLARALRRYRQYDFWYSVPDTLEGCHEYLIKAGMDFDDHEALEDAWTEWGSLHSDEEVDNG